ncbi:hypothetical protein V2I01_25365 [Micromonospora sp. BRA006-A]|nr:hypothetical protein [Micromonospora sp. BRA006-A]
MRRNLLAMLVALCTVTAAGAPAAAVPIGTLACPSVPATHDPAVTVIVYRVARSYNVNDKVMLSTFEAGWVESHEQPALRRQVQPGRVPAALGLRLGHAGGSWTRSTPPRSTSRVRSPATATTPATRRARSPSASSDRASRPVRPGGGDRAHAAQPGGAYPRHGRRLVDGRER